MLGNVLHHAHVESFQQSHALGETLFEVDLATHGPLCDCLDLVAHACPLCQFVDTFGLDERGVHIKTDQTAHAAVHVVALKREVDTHAL